MRKHFAVLLFVVLAVCLAVAGPVTENMTQFKTSVREKIHIESTTLLPDTTLTNLIREAVLWTSVDVGGVEAHHRFITVNGQAFYAIPDTTVRVLFATAIGEDGKTHSIKSFPPEFVQDMGVPVGDPSVDRSVPPAAYNIWADSIQLMPIPTSRVDTIVLKTYIEHTFFDTLGDDVAGGNDTLQFKSAYTEAAISYTCYTALTSLEMYEDAAVWLADYEKKKASLTQVYTRKFDQMAAPQ